MRNSKFEIWSRSRDPACAGDFGLALRRSVSVNLAELSPSPRLWRTRWRVQSERGQGALLRSEPRGRGDAGINPPLLSLGKPR